ncbi:MAG: nicotinate-nucleotide--dimethylbenzimidazole phosphoribosyltransferase [Paracoccaceae bacterium]
MASPAPFSTFSDIRCVLNTLPEPDAATCEQAVARNGQLTKPPGALGRLEDIAIWYAGWRGEVAPIISRPQVVVFAGNHGISAQGVSAFPAEVTEQMVLNFRAGGAAINQLSACFGANMTVHALELERPTRDFSQAAAMGEDECVAALAAGWNAVDQDADLLVTGEMGIANTTSAAAISLALFGGEAGDWVGRGTGVDDEGLARKVRVVREGVERHRGSMEDPLAVLACLGGREIAAMAGAILRARVLCVPVILDGFICTAAAAVLESAAHGALDHCVAGHVSAEGAHGRMLGLIGKEPLLSLGLRLGEGSGAALAIGVLKGALACHSGMATFGEAGVSQG